MGFIDTMKLGFKTIGNDIRVNSPELLIGAGVVAIIAGTVVGCKNTLKIKKVLEEHNEVIDDIKEYRGKGTYTEEEADRDLVVQYANTTSELIKAYAPVVALETIGIGCILYSHKIMKDRYFGALSTINGMQLAYSAYRDRVRKEVGDQKEYDLFHNIKRELIEEEYVDEDGKTKTRTKEVVVDRGSEFGHNSYPFDGECWGYKDMYHNKRNMDWVEHEFNFQLYNRGKETGFATFTKKEVTDYFGWSKDDPYPTEQLTNGWIYDREEDLAGKYEHYEDGVPRIIKLGVSPEFGTETGFTFVDLNCYPILPGMRAYQQKIQERRRIAC